MHLALASLAAGLGLEVDLSRVAPESPDYAALYAESAGRFLVSVDPAHGRRLEELFPGQPLTLHRPGAAAIKPSRSSGTAGRCWRLPWTTLRTAWERRFGSLV